MFLRLSQSIMDLFDQLEAFLQLNNILTLKL